MNKYLKIAVSVVAVAMIILIINIVLQEKATTDLSEEVMEKEPEVQPEAPIQPENGSSAPPVKVIPPEELEGFRRFLFYANDDQNSSNLVLDFTQESMPEQPAVYAMHEADAVFHIFFNKPINKEIEEMIHIEGAIEYTMELRNAEEIVIKVTDIQNDFTLHIEEQAPLTFYRQQPIQYSIDTDLLQDKKHLIVRGSSEFGTQILLSDQESQLVFKFPEAMLQSGVFDNQVSGKWLDDRTYQVRLRDDGETNFTFKRLFSVSGNYPLGPDHSVHIKKVPQQIWKDAISGEQVGWSERDPFYSEIVPSPDHEQYIGIIDLGPPQGDGDGWSYAFILEQKNKEPIVIKGSFYSTIEPYGSPIQWIDNDTLMYASYYGIYTYDIRTKEEQAVYEFQYKINGSVNFAVYDLHRDRLYAFIYNGKEIFYDELNKPSNDVIDLWIYDDLKSPPTVHKNFSGIVESSKISYLNLVVHPVAEGIYWTVVEDDRVYTLYEADLEGKAGSQAGNQDSLRTEGHVLTMLEQGVVLYNRTYYGVEQENLEPAYQIWDVNEPSGGQPDKQLTGQLKAMPDPPKDGHVGKFGNLLLAWNLEGTKYLYSAKDNTWNEWTDLNPTDHVPNQSANSYYRTAETE